MRLRTDIWISALIRQAERAGALVTVVKKGAVEAGTVFLIIDGGDGTSDLYGPAPQSIFETGRPVDRIFIQLAEKCTSVDLEARLSSEKRFDPDLWIVEIQDRQRRPFVNLAGEISADPRS
ncbi:MAG: DUF1491 family protein [Hyphomicrobiales bacterium]|nr:DUF1491 family protein [Hyphomicrobiales bacterium]